MSRNLKFTINAHSSSATYFVMTCYYFVQKLSVFDLGLYFKLVVKTSIQYLCVHKVFYEFTKTTNMVRKPQGGVTPKKYVNSMYNFYEIVGIDDTYKGDILSS